ARQHHVVEGSADDDASRRQDAPDGPSDRSRPELAVGDVGVPLVRITEDEPAQPMEGYLRLAVLRRGGAYQPVTATDRRLELLRVDPEMVGADEVQADPLHEVEDRLLGDGLRPSGDLS